MVTGDRIKELRIKNNMSQEELGQKVGLHKAAIYKYETARVVNIKRTTLIKLADVLGTTPMYLMGISDEKKPAPKSESGLNAEIKNYLDLLTEDELRILHAQIKGIISNREQ